MLLQTESSILKTNPSLHHTWRTKWVFALVNLSPVLKSPALSVCATHCRPLQDKKREHPDRGEFFPRVKAEEFADSDVTSQSRRVWVRCSKRPQEGRARASPPARREGRLCLCSPATGCASAGVRSTAPGRTAGRGTPRHRTWEETPREGWQEWEHKRAQTPFTVWFFFFQSL